MVSCTLCLGHFVGDTKAPKRWTRRLEVSSFLQSTRIPIPWALTRLSWYLICCSHYFYISSLQHFLMLGFFFFFFSPGVLYRSTLYSYLYRNRARSHSSFDISFQGLIPTWLRLVYSRTFQAIRFWLGYILALIIPSGPSELIPMCFAALEWLDRNHCRSQWVLLGDAITMETATF